MKYLLWLLKAAIFFTLFAFALNNQQDATVHFFFGTQWRAPLVLVVLTAFACRPGHRRAGHGAALVEAPHRRTRVQRPQQMPPPQPARLLQRLPLSAERPCPPWNLTFSWMLLGLPLAFVLGWLASRFDLRQLRARKPHAPKAYFKGLNFLLNEQQDQAIDAFIEAVQNDPDTSELHFALGNLFRRRGEYDRAVRVHEHLLSRGDLSRADRERAQHALALDFLKAGLLDRAEDALRAWRARPLRPRPAWPCWPFTSARATGPRPPHCAQDARRRPGRLQHPAGALPVRAGPGAASPQGDRSGARPAGPGMGAAPEAARARIELARLQQLMGHTARRAGLLQRAGRAGPAALPLAAPLLVEAATPAAASPKCLPCCSALRAGPIAGCAGSIVAWSTPTTPHPQIRAKAAVVCAHLDTSAPWLPRPSGWPANGWNTKSSIRRFSGARHRRPPAHALPLRGLRVRSAPAFLAMPGLPDLGQLPRPPGGRTLSHGPSISVAERRTALLGRCVRAN
jgi:tetratricopeptide (TPR) repeat protein